MAGRKEYEVMFALNASMNGNFHGAFSKAQQEFTRLGKEIQGLHKVQGDISSYQKQEQAVAATSAKLANLQKQHDLLQKEIVETTGSTTGLEREKVRLEQRIKDTETALERQNQKLETTGARLKEAQVNTGDLTGESARLASQLDELRARQQNVAETAKSMGQAHEEAADEAQGFGEKSVQAFGAAQEAITSAGIALALKEVADAYVECVRVAADFQEGMSGVQAISGATAEEMALLSDKAKEMGAATSFTAREASDAMGYMAMAGWKTNDMLDGLEGIMNLAAASGEDLASTSDIVTDALTAFGLKASDSGRFADILAVAASNANTNVGMMGDTFKYVAPIAGALGYTAEDTSVSIGLIANSGIKASQAGTTLSSIFTRLSTDAGASSTQLGALGVLTEKLGVAFYNADGSTREWNAVLADSRAAWAGLTEQQQVNYAKTIAGQEAVAGWLALMNAADTDVQKLTTSVDNCSGAAQRMAEIKLDNLNGQLTLMDSAMDALKTTIGEQFNPELRGLAEVGTDVLTGIDWFVQKNPALTKGLMAGTGAFMAMGTAIVGVNAAMKAFQALNVAALFAGPAGAILGGAAAVAGLTAAVVALVTATDDGIPSVKELTGAAQDMREAMAEAGAAYEDTANKTQATAEVAGMYIDKLEELEAAQGENARESQEYQNVLALLLRTMPELSDCISETTDEYGRSTYALNADTQALRQNTEEYKKNAQAKAYQDYINSLYDNYGAVMQEAAANSIGLTQAQIKLENAEKKHAAATERMNELDRKAAEGCDVLADEYFEVENALYEAREEIEEAQKSIDHFSAAIEADTQAVAEAEAELNSAAQAYELLNGAAQEMTDGERRAMEQTQELNGAINTTMEAVQELTAAYYEAYDAALESVGGQYALWDEAAKVAETSAGDINAALESQAQYWQDYNANLQALSDRAGDIEGLSTVIASFADGSADSVNAVAGMANATDEELAAMVANWKEVQREQKATAQSLADMKTGMSAVMGEWGLALAEDIESMNLSDEAREAGRETIQGYVDAANEMLPQVRAAFESLSNAAVAAIGQTYYERKADRIRNGSEDKTLRGFASGTGSAPPGWAWVGEEGPELMRMHGGETVLPAEISREFALLTVYQNQIAAYAKGTGNAPEAAAEQIKTVNNAYANYSESVYNTGAHNVTRRGDYTYTTSAAPQQPVQTGGGSVSPAPPGAVQAVEAVPSSNGGGGAPITVELHFHIEGSAAPETVDRLREYVEYGEFEARVLEVVEKIEADRKRERW